MAIVRLEALKSLAECIELSIPELSTAICAGPADSGTDQVYPSLSITPSKFAYDPDQALQVFDPGPGCVVMNVGRHTAAVQLRLAAASRGRRYALEQKIIDLFLATPLHPGIIMTSVTACEQLGDFRAAWELQDDEWQDELAFDKLWQSIMTVNGVLPALVTRDNVPTLETLQLGLEAGLGVDFDESFTATTFNTSPKIEVVQVNEDGTITAVP